MKNAFEKISARAKKEQGNFELYNAMYLMCRDKVAGKEKWAMCAELKERIAEAVEKGVRCKADLLEVFKEVLLIEARGLRFDSYMQYIELDREPDKRFWLPRREKLLPLCEAIQRLIDDETDVLTISICPGAGKSTLEIFLLSMLIGHAPDSPCLASGHSGILTQSLYDGVMDIINDNVTYKWHDVFPDADKVLTNSKEQTIDLGKKHRFSSLTCRAINASLTGATRCEQILCADDMVSGIEEAVSPARLDKLWYSIVNDLLSRTKLGCKILFLATRWSVHDPIGRLKLLYEDDPNVRFEEFVLPALDENGESTVDYDYGVGFDTAYIENKMNSMDDVSFKALYMNQPIERDGLLYPSENLKYYFDLPEGTPDAIISVCDTKDKGKDFCVLPVGYLYGQNWYIEDVVCDDSLPEVFMPRLVDCLERNNVQMARFESNSAGGQIASQIQKVMREKNHRVSISTEYTTANKETKILVNSDWVKANCYFKDRSLYPKKSDYGKFMDMLCSYTHVGKNAHDDAPDAMAMFAIFADSMTAHKVETFRRPF